MNVTLFPFWTDRRLLRQRAALLLNEQQLLSDLRKSLVLHARRLGRVSMEHKNEATQLLACRVAEYYRRKGRFIRDVKQLNTQLAHRIAD